MFIYFPAQISTFLYIPLCFNTFRDCLILSWTDNSPTFHGIPLVQHTFQYIPLHSYTFLYIPVLGKVHLSGFEGVSTDNGRSYMVLLKFLDIFGNFSKSLNCNNSAISRATDLRFCMEVDINRLIHSNIVLYVHILSRTDINIPIHSFMFQYIS